MVILLIISVVVSVAIIIALLITGVVFRRRFVYDTTTLAADLEATNMNYIELMQEREHQEYLMDTVDDITFNLLGMPDHNTEQFENYLFKGLQIIAMCGQLDAIKVYRNMLADTGEWQFETQLAWRGDGTHEIDNISEVFCYDTIPGRYESLVKLEFISESRENLSEAEQKFLWPETKSVLIIPVFFQERFWGTVWYEDFNNPEAFSPQRISLMRSSALMIVSAVHRKRQARRIHEATHRMRLMLDAMPVCCFIWNHNASIVDVNKMAVNFFGYRGRDELISNYNETNPEFQPSGQRSIEAHIENLRTALEVGELSFEWIHKMPGTGELVPTEVDFFKMDYDGKHVVAAYVRDVREHRRMIAEIEHRGHLLYTVNAASNVLLQSDTDEFDNALFRSLSMMARAVEVERIFVWEYLQSPNSRYFSQIYEWIGDATVFQRQNMPIHFENDTIGAESRLLRGLFLAGLSANLPDEARAALRLTETKSYLIIPIFLRHKLWGVVGFGDMRRERSFSESDESILRNGGLLLANALLRNEMTFNIKQNAKKLTIALEEAEAASRAKSNFLSTMSHEMRTPLNAIMGMSNIGRSSTSLERKDYSFDKINSASNQLLATISDVLDMSKIEANMFALSDITFELEKTLGNAVDVNRFRIEEKSQKFTLEICPNVPKIIVADDHRLTQVLTNLLSNASKFTDNGKEIRLSVSATNIEDDACTLRFDVTDQGIGISQENQDKLFHSFVQAEDSTTRKFGGTGLGLAISKRIVELMDGNIWVNSTPGKGSTFSFLIKAGLPNADELHKIAAKENAPETVLTFPGRHILVVEDVDVNREILMYMLEDSALEITYAENGEEAFHIFRDSDTTFDLVFMDVHMPVMDGYQATAEIRALNTDNAKNVPIIAMTANVFKDDIDKCLAVGMNAHLGKPLDFEAVKAKLHEYLG